MGNIAPTGWYADHPFSSSVGQTNVLLDPTFETVRDSGTNLGTGATVNGIWQGHYALTTGTVPTTRSFSRWLTRGSPNSAPFNSGVVYVELSGFGTNAFTGDVYVYPVTDFNPSVIVLDWLVAGCRLYLLDTPTNTLTSLTAAVEIYDATNSAVIATGDALDLMTATIKTSYPIMAATNQTAAVFRARSWRWRLKFHVVKPASTTATADIYLAEPQFHFNYMPQLLPYAPLLGNWFPGTAPATGVDISSAGTTLTATRGTTIHPISASGGSITLTSTPTIADGVDGQEIVLLHVGSANNVVIQDQGTLGSSNLRLTGASVTIGPRDSVRLTYSAAVGDWVQIGPLVAVI